MKILFLGGKEIGCRCLQYIIDSREQLIATVVNEKDTVSNRWYPSVAEMALKNHIPIYFWEKINCEDAYNTMKELSPDIIFSISYDQILKKDIIDIPKYGCINLHNALAEQYRGCYATAFTIINEEEQTGVTLHYIDEGVDSGPIIVQSCFKIENTDTGYSLYKRCTDIGFKLFKENFRKILEGKIEKVKIQDKNSAKYYKRVFPSQEIDFSKSGREIYNHIRACIFEPFQMPYFHIGKDKYEVRKIND